MQNYQFIAKDFLPTELKNDIGKKLVFLWLMTKDERQSIETTNAQALAPFYASELQALSPESAFREIVAYVDSLSHPSAVSKWINNLDVLAVDWFAPKLRSLNRSHYLQPPSLEISSEPLQFVSHLQPPTSFIAHLNSIDPQLTGYLLENIFAKLLYPSEDIWRREENVLEPIDPGFSSDNLAWNPENQVYYDLLLKNDFGEFKSTYHALLYLSIKQYFNLDFSAQGIIKASNFLDFFTRVFPQALKLLHSYSQALASTNYVKYFKSKIALLGEKAFPFHSIPLHGEIENKEYTGEADFIIGDTIIDAKAVRSPIPRTWFAQVNIYRQLYKFPINNLEVISFLNNSIYRFKF